MNNNLILNKTINHRNVQIDYIYHGNAFEKKEFIEAAKKHIYNKFKIDSLYSFYSNDEDYITFFILINDYSVSVRYNSAVRKFSFPYNSEIIEPIAIEPYSRYQLLQKVITFLAEKYKISI